jgi:hypothetical protein
VMSPSAGGAISTLYGIRVEDQTRSGSTAWNLYSAGGSSRNYFEGQVGIGTSNPTAGKLLHVVGDVRHEGTLQSGNLATGTSQGRLEMQHEFTDLSVTTAGLWVVAQGNDTTTGGSMALWGANLVAQTQSTSARNGFSLIGARMQATHNGSGAVSNTYGALIGNTLNPSNAGNTTPGYGTKISMVTTANSTPSLAYAAQINTSIYSAVAAPNVRGADVNIYLDSTGAGATLAYGLYLNAPGGTGAVGTMHGLYIENQGRAGVTTAYNILSKGATAQNVVEGDVEVSTVGRGVIMKSPNGSRWRLTVSDAGAAVFTAI